MGAGVRSLRVSLSVLLVVGIAVGGSVPRSWAAPLTSARRSGAVAELAGGRVRAVKVVGHVHQAVAFTFDDRGRIWYVQKSVGDIRIVDPSHRGGFRFALIPDVVTEREHGVLGIALHPRYPKVPLVYVFATRWVHGVPTDQILRLRNVHGHGKKMTVLFSSRASAEHEHSGGRLLFGPDHMLYAVVGDATQPNLAQARTSSRGKILRMTPDGTIPKDNPFHSRVFAWGIRNSFGFDFDPQGHRLWESENGPECNDELNRIPRGRNMGWGPGATCSASPSPPRNTNQDGPSPVLPQRWFTPTIAPTGIGFCDGCRLGPVSEGALYMGTYNTGEIRRFGLSADRMRVVNQKTVFRSPSMVLSIERDPEGRLYYSSYVAIYRLRWAA